MPKAALFARSEPTVYTAVWLKQRHHVVPRSVLARNTVPAALKAGCPPAGASYSTQASACSSQLSVRGHRSTREDRSQQQRCQGGVLCCSRLGKRTEDEQCLNSFVYHYVIFLASSQPAAVEKLELSELTAVSPLDG
jgi:hypothetical protein